MAAAEKITSLYASWKASKAALRVRLAALGVWTSDRDTMSTLCNERMDALAPAWKPRPDWWDMQAFYDAYTPPAGYRKRGFVLYANTEPTANFGLIAGTTWFRTTDGTDSAATSHTWDAAQDKPCPAGYSTRGVVFCSTVGSRDIGLGMGMQPRGALWVMVDDANLTHILLGSSNHPSNAILECFQTTERTTASATALAGYAFSKCYALRKAVLPEGLTTIPAYAFNGCFNLSEIRWATTLSAVTGRTNFTDCYKLPFDDCPMVLDEVPQECFLNCQLLKKPEIVSSAITVGGAALRNTGLKNLRFTKLAAIGDTAFQGTAIDSLSLPASLGSMTPNSFQYLYSTARLEIAEGWVPPVSPFDLRFCETIIPSNFVEFFLRRLGANTGAAVTITIYPTLFNQLTPEEKQIATDRNYTLVGAA